MGYRFLHLSDIHFGQKSGTVAKHDHIRNALVKDAESLTKKRGPAARIVLTGDISYSGKPDEYKTATQSIFRYWSRSYVALALSRVNMTVETAKTSAVITAKQAE
jgi:3',5'-cyclic AMP phosphodiesterase CpdA